MRSKDSSATPISEAEQIGGQLQAARDALVRETVGFNEAMAEARKRHWNIASLKAEMSLLNRRVDDLGRSDLCVPASTVKVEPIALDLPTIVEMRQRKVAHLLKLIANDEAHKVDGAKWRAAFFPNTPTSQEQLRNSRSGRSR